MLEGVAEGFAALAGAEGAATMPTVTATVDEHKRARRNDRKCLRNRAAEQRKFAIDLMPIVST